MALQSMTGFSRSQGEYQEFSWTWELRSVNGKGLDVRLRIPTGLEAIEVKARGMISKAFARGNLQVNLQTMQQGSNLLPVVNEAGLAAVLEAAKSLQKSVGGELPTPAELMSMRGVVDLSEPALDEEARQARDEAILTSLEEAISSLKDMRIAEGKAVGDLLLNQVSTISDLRDQIENNEARKPDNIKMQLQRQVEKLVEASDALDPQRLHQEAVILAAKADLQEELDRLKVHVQSARTLLEGEGPAGRKLDFLAQEFNRECNTICSKSNAAAVTDIALDMKLVIDQFREQIQNME